MLNGDFTAFASPACNGGTQRTLTGGFVGNRIDPSRLSPVSLNFLKHVPVSTDPCGKASVRHPEQQHRAPGAGEGRLHDQQRTRSLFARYFYAVYDNPATYDGSNVLTLSRTGQNNQVHSLVLGHNSGAVAVDAQLAARHDQPDAERPAAAAVFQRRPISASKVFSLVPGYVGISVTGNGFSIGNGGDQPGLLQLEGLADRRTTSTWSAANHQFSIGGNWIHSRIETLNNRPTNGAFTFNGQSTGLSLADFMLGIVSGGFIQGNPVYDYDHSDYVGAYAQDNWRVASEPDGQSRPALGAVPAGAEHLLVGQPLRSVRGSTRTCTARSIRRRRPGLMFPGDAGYPGDAHDVRQDRAVRAAGRRGLDAERRRADERSRVVGRVLRHAAPVLQHALREQPAVGRADHDSQSARRLRRSVSRLSRRQPVSRR